MSAMPAASALLCFIKTTPHNVMDGWWWQSVQTDKLVDLRAPMVLQWTQQRQYKHYKMNLHWLGWGDKNLTRWIKIIKNLY